MPVAYYSRKVLYIAAYLPAQALRSLRLMLSPYYRALLYERLILWKRAPPVYVVANPYSLR